MYRLLCNLCTGKELSKDILDLVKSSGFILLRLDAQEEITKRSHCMNSSIPQQVQSLCKLVFGLEAFQRIGTNYGFSKNIRIATGDFSTTGVSAFNGSKAGAGYGLFEFPSPLKRPNNLMNIKTVGSTCDEIGSSVFCITDNNDVSKSIENIHITGRPIIIEVSSHSVQADLSDCVAIFLKALLLSDSNDLLTPMNMAKLGKSACRRPSSKLSSTPFHPSLSTSSILEGDANSVDLLTPKKVPYSACQSDLNDQLVLLEVAIAVASSCHESDDEALLYETVYCGSCTNFQQLGLSPSCTYLLRCRATCHGIILDWSVPIEFTTLSGISFTFNPLKCGSDIILKNDNLVASYNGDDTWSTVLGNRPYVSGHIYWEIKVLQSSTAYLFVGVARSEVDLYTFLGGCPNGWGFIGEQALYHNRENVKGYGETFSPGDIIGISLDFYVGTLSFSKNGKNLGLAFDKIFGELYPAVAFYNVGQELEIVTQGFKSSCNQDNYQSLPAKINLHGKFNYILIFFIYLFIYLFIYSFVD